MKCNRTLVPTLFALIAAAGIVSATGLQPAAQPPAPTKPAQPPTQPAAPAKPAAPVPGATLYDRLGGIDAIATVMDDFTNRLALDKAITSNPQVAEKMKTLSVPALKFKLTAQVAEATGGPWKYAGKDMKASHKDLKITEAEWNAGLEDLRATLTKYNVPAKEQAEVIAIIGSTKKDIVTVHDDVNK